MREVICIEAINYIKRKKQLSRSCFLRFAGLR